MVTRVFKFIVFDLEQRIGLYNCVARDGTLSILCTKRFKRQKCIKKTEDFITEYEPQKGIQLTKGQ
jgi:hypothetical protein